MQWSDLLEIVSKSKEPHARANELLAQQIEEERVQRGEIPSQAQRMDFMGSLSAACVLCQELAGKTVIECRSPGPGRTGMLPDYVVTINDTKFGINTKNDAKVPAAIVKLLVGLRASREQERREAKMMAPYRQLTQMAASLGRANTIADFDERLQQLQALRQEMDKTIVLPTDLAQLK